MAVSNPDSVIELSLLTTLDPEAVAAAPVEQEVMELFDRCAPALLRYVASFDLRRDEAEDVVQDVFLALFHHLQRGRSRHHLRGWLFRVAHNLALRERRKVWRRAAFHGWDAAAAARLADPSPDPESQLVQHERQWRLTSVLRALPERDRRCLSLRAEGLRYREIAGTLGISLGSVAKSLTRAITRLVNADER
jgi:RNA polymerase sigma-70 factor (ECF subfamily)